MTSIYILHTPRGPYIVQSPDVGHPYPPSSPRPRRYIARPTKPPEELEKEAKARTPPPPPHFPFLSVLGPTVGRASRLVGVREA